MPRGIRRNPPLTVSTKLFSVEITARTLVHAHSGMDAKRLPEVDEALSVLKKHGWDFEEQIEQHIPTVPEWE